MFYSYSFLSLTNSVSNANDSRLTCSTEDDDFSNSSEGVYVGKVSLS